jgi:hypothetical protein
MPPIGYNRQPNYRRKVKFNPEDLVRQTTAARMRGVSTQAIVRLVQRGKLTKVVIDGYTFVLRDEVEKFKPGRSGRPKSQSAKKTRPRNSN